MTRMLERLYLIAGIAVATGLAVVSAWYEAGWCSLYVFSVRCPLSLVLALVGNASIVWFATFTTGRRGSGVIPAIAWCLVWFIGTNQTREGDLIVLSDNWVGVATTILGPLAFAVALYRVVMARSGPLPSVSA